MKGKTMAIDTKALVPQFDNQQLDLIRKTVAKGTTQEQFMLFLEVCKYHRLNPFARQIYAVVRSNQLTIQTSIDGYRLLAERSGRYTGQIGPEWAGPDGQWVDVWVKDEPPVAARVGVLKSGCERPFWGVVKYKAFYVSSNPLWNKMPDHMLAIRAEALALRKAFPAEMSGIYTKEEMEQADDMEHIAVPVSHLNETVVTEVVESEPAPINAGQIKTIQMIREKLGKSDLPGVSELTQEDAKAIIVQLNTELRNYNQSKLAVKPAQPVAPKAQEQPKQEMVPEQALKARVLAALDRAKALNQFEVEEGNATKNVAGFLKFASDILKANVTNTAQLTASRVDMIEQYLNAKDAG